MDEMKKALKMGVACAILLGAVWLTVWLTYPWKTYYKLPLTGIVINKFIHHPIAPKSSHYWIVRVKYQDNKESNLANFAYYQKYKIGDEIPVCLLIQVHKWNGVSREVLVDSCDIDFGEYPF